jgi:hypothetical protein
MLGRALEWEKGAPWFCLLLCLLIHPKFSFKLDRYSPRFRAASSLPNAAPTRAMSLSPPPRCSSQHETSAPTPPSDFWIHATHVQQLMVDRPILKQLRDEHLVPLSGPLVSQQLGIWVDAEDVGDEDDPVDFAVALRALGRGDVAREAVAGLGLAEGGAFVQVCGSGKTCRHGRTPRLGLRRRRGEDTHGR